MRSRPQSQPQFPAEWDFVNSQLLEVELFWSGISRRVDGAGVGAGGARGEVGGGGGARCVGPVAVAGSAARHEPHGWVCGRAAGDGVGRGSVGIAWKPAWRSASGRSRCAADGRVRGAPDMTRVGSQLGGRCNTGLW